MSELSNISSNNFSVSVIYQVAFDLVSRSNFCLFFFLQFVCRLSFRFTPYAISLILFIYFLESVSDNDIW